MRWANRHHVSHVLIQAIESLEEIHDDLPDEDRQYTLENIIAQLEELQSDIEEDEDE